MITFKTLDISDKGWVDRLFQKSGYRGCEYSFAGTVLWAEVYRKTAAEVGGFVVVRSELGSPSYLFPAGEGDLHAVIGRLKAQSEEEGVPFVFYAVDDESRPKLEELYPGRFHYEELDDAREYLYLSESLRTLAGKKLHAKRNHINRFLEQNPDWSFEEITKENIGECYEMNKDWCRLYGCDQNESLRQEACAVDYAFEHFFALDFRGGLLRAGGRIVAYSMGERLTPDTFDVRIEKAYQDVQGSYALINREFCRAFCKDVTYVNREDDTGAEGLRKAKLSYRPAIILKKYRATWLGD